MNQHDNMNPKDDALKEFIEAAAQQTNPNQIFQDELEKRLINAHKPNAGFRLPVFKQFAPALGWAIAIIVLAIGFNWMMRRLNPVQMPASNDNTCPVTQPNGSLPPGETVESPNYLGNDTLWTVLWPDGKIYMLPENQEADGSFSMKWGWWRGISGPLTIEGRRLDTESAPLRADIPNGYGDTGFQVSALIFPSTGCWEVTGRVGDASLTFVTEVLFNVVTPTPAAFTVPTSTPEGEAHDWNGTTLYLNAPLPDTPAEANIFVPQPEHITGSIEDAQKLAEQFGLQGKIYNALGELPANYNLLVVDGKQRLNVRSDQYFTYYPDYVESNLGDTTMDNPNSLALIDEFLKTHGFDFPYKIEPSELYGGYYAQPLTSDGFALHHEYFKSNGLLFKFNGAGIVSVEASLLKYSNIFQPYAIRSAKEAFQKLLDPNATAGFLMGMHSSTKPPQTWVRIRPKDQTITVYGFLGAYTSIDGSAPLVTLDGYTVTGNPPEINNFLGTNSLAYTFVEATGQFHTQNDMDVFKVESWKPYNGQEEGYQGTIQREGEQVVINTIEGKKLILPDMPSDVPLPLENAYIMGVTQGDTFEWKSFDTRLAQGGGGGGGGGSGFHKLNLTGTPVPLPTPVPQNNFILPPPFDQPRVDELRGMLSVAIHKKVDGSQIMEYSLSGKDQSGQYYSAILTGANLQGLDKYHGLPINVSGTINVENALMINVERYEIPFPDLQFQIVKGTQELTSIEGQSATVFTTEDGASYIQLLPSGDPDSSIIGVQGDLIQQEVLIIPDETFGSMPALRIYAGSIIEANSPELTITANQPYTYDDSANINIVPGNYVPPTVTIEKVELVYYVPDPRYLSLDQNSNPAYIEPAWRFYGHYSNGDEFETLIQALKDEFLLPELAPYTQPG